MTAYILTTDAEADLRGIIRYTRKQWGPHKFVAISPGWNMVLQVLLPGEVPLPAETVGWPERVLQ